MNPFISCRLDFEEGKAREGRALPRQHLNSVDDQEKGGERRHGAPLPALNKTFHLYCSLSLMVAVLMLLSSSFSFHFLQDQHHSGATWRCSSRHNEKQCFGHTTNHMYLGNDRVISHATAQRTALQSGLKTRQGFSYLLNGDLDRQVRWAWIQQDITTSMLPKPRSGCSGSVFYHLPH